MIDALTMGSVVRRSARQYPNRTAMIHGEERCTFAEYNRRVNKSANLLTALGLVKGDHIAVLGRNSIRYLEIYHASAKVGTVFSPLNWRLSPKELAFIVSDADNKTLLVEAELQALAQRFVEEIPGLQVVVYGGDVTLPGALDYAELFNSASDDEPEIDVNGEDSAVIMYTSGTTGLPKGAVLTHTNVCWDAVSYLTYIPPQQGDRFLLSMPMSHVSGLHTQTTAFLIRGLPIVIMSQWDPEGACQLIEQHRITLAYILVTPLNQLLSSDCPEKYDLSSLNRVMTAAAKYTAELPMQVQARLGVEKIYFMYGLSEAAPIVSTTEYTSDMVLKPNTLGFPVWYCDVRIADENDNPLPVGEVGEIQVRGPNVFKGYYKRPEANAETLRGGWLHTGDLAYMDKDNFMYFVDRKKDMIKSGGENVYSLEVELAISQAAPEALEVAVLGLPDEKWGEAVSAFIVLKEGQKLDAETLIARLREHLGGYKLPKNVFFVESLPKNVSGKVLKRKLKDTCPATESTP